QGRQHRNVEAAIAAGSFQSPAGHETCDPAYAVIASEGKQSRAPEDTPDRDCFVALRLLAMTPFCPRLFLPIREGRGRDAGPGPPLSRGDEKCLVISGHFRSASQRVCVSTAGGNGLKLSGAFSSICSRLGNCETSQPPP